MCPAVNKAAAKIREDDDNNDPVVRQDDPSSDYCSQSVVDDARKTLRQGTFYGASSLGLLLVASSITLPHQQSRRDALHCDNLCLGSMASGRSTLKLLGATLVGRLSDTTTLDSYGGARKWCLWLGVVSSALAIAAANQAQSIPQLWLSIVPQALEQNVNILKALLSEYHESVPAITAGERASSTGKLGMAVGLAMMIGPVVGTALLSTFEQATRLSLLLLLLACGLIARLPSTTTNNPSHYHNNHTKTKSSQRGIFSLFVDVPSARSPAAIFHLTCRLLSTLSFHIYQTILTSSLRERFHFGPKEYGTFFSVIGLFFALSQGFMANRLLDRFGETPQRRVRLLLLCSFLVGASRYLAFFTHSLPTLYILFSLLVTAYGVISTVFSADTSQIASPQELGSFFGVLSSVEQGAGMAGPLLGGALSYYVHPTMAPLLAVMVLNIATLILIYWGYDRFIIKSKRGDKIMKSE